MSDLLRTYKRNELQRRMQEQSNKGALFSVYFAILKQKLKRISLVKLMLQLL